jgi:hypothetical protein
VISRPVDVHSHEPPGQDEVPVGTFRSMNRPGTIVSLTVLGLALSCPIAGCGTSGSGTPAKSLEMINNTSAAVTMRSCPASAADAQQCSATVKIAPGSSADFPLSSPGSGARLVVITGYDGQPRCLMIPTTKLPESATADVADANSANCIGPFGGPAPPA